MGAAKKFWALPELGEGLISFLDPLSTLQLARSDMLDDLETSLTSKVWNELIRRSSLAQPNPNPHSLQKDLKDESCVDAFIALLEAQTVSVQFLSVRKAELGEEDWQALAGALKAKGKPAVKVDRVVLSREDLTDARRSIFKAIWNATAYGFTVCDNTDGSYSQFVCKSEYEYGGAWTRLKQIAAMTEDEFTADCKLQWEDEEEEHDGEEEESGEEDHDGEDEGDEEDG